MEREISSHKFIYYSVINLYEYYMHAFIYILCVYATMCELNTNIKLALHMYINSKMPDFELILLKSLYIFEINLFLEINEIIVLNFSLFKLFFLI